MPPRTLARPTARKRTFPVVLLPALWLGLAAAGCGGGGEGPDGSTPDLVADTGPDTGLDAATGDVPFDRPPPPPDTPPGDVPAEVPPADGGPDLGGDGGPEPDCGFGELGAPDRDRVILLGHPFGAATGEPGTEIRSLSLAATGPAAGMPVDDGIRLDVGTRVRRLAMVPSGTIALVLGEDEPAAGKLVSVAVRGPGDLEVLDTVELPSAGYGDLVVAPGGQRIYVVGSNVDEKTSGISTVQLGCNGELTVRAAEFFGRRLSSSLVLLPGFNPTTGGRAILLGGQAAFDPIDPRELRLLELAPGGGFSEIAAFDLYGDAVDAGRIGLSPDGSTLLVPNGSPTSTEGAQVLVVAVQGDTLTEADRFMDLSDAREALFSTDGQTALVSLFEPNRVVVFSDDGAGLSPTSEITGIGLADKMAQITRGSLQGLVLLPSVDPSAASGPNLAVLRITGPGQVEDLGQLELGSGSENIPDAIAVTP